MADRVNTENESELNELKSSPMQIDIQQSTSTLIPESFETENTALPNEVIIDHKTEANKGNFMPSSIMIERKLFNVNEPINSKGDSLLHLAVTFSFLNVVRTLIELFEADINITNNQGQTPLQIICANKLKDSFILSYFLKNDNIKLDIPDKEGITPLIESIKNNYTYAFLSLVYLKCNINHKDYQSNSLFYYSLKYDNKAALTFLIKHGESLSSSIKSLFSEKQSPSDLLIETKGTKCTRYLLKYHHKALSNESLIACIKKLGEFSHYNKFNYEIIKTTFNYKEFSPVKALSSIILGSYEFKVFNLYFWFVDLFLPSVSRMIRRMLVIIYSFIMCTLFAYHYFLLNPNITFSFSFIFALYQLSTYAFFLFAFIKLFLPKPDSKITEPNYHFSNKETEKDTVAYLIQQALERNIFDLPNEDEICTICLIKKQKPTNHCHRCNKCVKNFYFHSMHLDVCINSDNAGYYLTYLSCIWSIHFYLIMQFYQFIDLINGHSLYNSAYLFANLYNFVNNLNLLQFIFLIYLFISGIIIFGHSMTILICKGTNTPFYLMFRYHKIPSDNLMIRGKFYFSIPTVNLVSCQDFFKNLFCCKKNNSEAAIPIIN